VFYLNYRVHKFPVLNYHGLASSDSLQSRASRFWVSQRVFAEQLKQIRLNGLCTRRLVELWVSSDAAGLNKFVSITFDDGRASDFEVAFPLLMHAQSVADFFINPATIGCSGYLTWEQVREMQRAGLTFQSHGQEHVDHSGLALNALRRQLHESKCVIEDRTGAEVQFFAAPYGEWNYRMADIACEVGYRAVCITGGQWTKSQARILDRIGINSQTSSKHMNAILTGSPTYFVIEGIRFGIKRLPKWIALRLMRDRVQAWRDRRHA
jgi:peptidoglycan/xylan/chitin deacetylase (PgdA/CDA1 family)